MRLGILLLLLMIVTYPFLARTPPTGPSGPGEGAAGMGAAGENDSGGMTDTDHSGNAEPEAAARAAETQGAALAPGEVPAEESPRAPAPDETDAAEEAAVAAAASLRETAPASEESDPTALFSLVKGLFPVPTSILSLGNDSVWLVSINEVVEITVESPLKVRRRLDGKLFDSMFDSDLAAITAAAPGPGGHVWVGTKDGELLRYSNYDWKIILERKKFINGKIRAIGVLGDEVFIGGKGLWKLNRTTGKVTRYPGFAETRVQVLNATKDNRLFLGASSGVWSYTDRGWTEFWKLSGADKIVRAIHWNPQRGMLVGTDDGLVAISPAGVVTERALPGTVVTSISEDPEGNAWIGTQKDGIKLWKGRTQWFQANDRDGFPGVNVEHIHADERGLLWISIVGRGFFYSNASRVLEWISQFPDRSRAQPSTGPAVFSSACKAAEQELGGRPVSGDIARDRVDGVDMVFFDGRRVCPEGAAYRKGDGVIAIADGWTITLHSRGSRTEIAFPKEYDADQLRHIFLDSKQRVWVASAGQGLAMTDGTSWNMFTDKQEVYRNPVNAIIEDEGGVIWIATAPVFDPQSRTYRQPNLHRYDASGQWIHYSPLDGLISWSSTAAALMKDGRIAIGSPMGLSIISSKGVSVFGEREGLPEKYIQSIGRDPSGDLWMSHLYYGDGITWFDGVSFHRVTSADGLFSSRISHVAHDASNRVWILASNGQTGVYPRSFFEARAKPAAGSSKPATPSRERRLPDANAETGF